MTCQACAVGNLPTDDPNNGCQLSAAALLATDDTAWPPDMEHPPGVPLSHTVPGRGEMSSNCMFGPPNETLCTRRIRVVEHGGDVYTAGNELGAAIPADAPDNLIGWSPYRGAGTTVLMLDIPTEDLTACVQVCEISIRVQRLIAAELTYIIGSATAGVALGKANLRSTWYATEDNVALPTSTASISKLGTRLRSTEGRCNCDCLRAWGPYDLAAQLEFTYPSGFVPLLGDIVVVDYQVDRTFLAARSCAMPERCGQPRYSDPLNAPP